MAAAFSSPSSAASASRPAATASPCSSSALGVLGPPVMETALPPTAVPSTLVSVPVSGARGSGATTPSAAAGDRRRSRVRPAWEGAISSISSQICSTDSNRRSAPRPKARSVAIIQSGRAVPGGVTARDRVLTRPSRLVVVPSVSANPATGRTTSA